MSSLKEILESAMYDGHGQLVNYDSESKIFTGAYEEDIKLEVKDTLEKQGEQIKS